MKRTGVCSNGTRRGTSMTSSNRTPNNKGMTPNKTLKATNDLRPQMHHSRILSIIAALPCGSHDRRRVTALAVNQQR